MKTDEKAARPHIDPDDVEAAFLAGKELGFAASALVMAADEKGWLWLRSALSPVTLAKPHLGARKAAGPDSPRRLTCGEHDADGALQGWGLSLLRKGSWAWGTWSRGHLHGTGTYVHSDGARYMGSWRNGLQHGEGILIQPDGTAHEGKWSHGKHHSAGVRITHRGRQRTTSTWDANVIDGPVAITVCACFDLTPDPVEQLKHHNASPTLCQPFGFAAKERYDGGLPAGLFTNRYCNGDVFETHYDSDSHHIDRVRFTMSPRCPDERFRDRVIENVAWEHHRMTRADGSLTYVMGCPDPATAPDAFRLYHDYYKSGYLPVEDRDRADISALLDRAAQRLPTSSSSSSSSSSLPSSQTPAQE